MVRDTNLLITPPNKMHLDCTLTNVEPGFMLLEEFPKLENLRQLNNVLCYLPSLYNQGCTFILLYFVQLYISVCMYSCEIELAMIRCIHKNCGAFIQHGSKGYDPSLSGQIKLVHTFTHLFS